MRPKSSKVADYCTRDVVTVGPETPLTDCAKQMHDRHVGCVVIVGEKKKQGKPLGMLTDRDIAIEAVAFGLDPATLTAGDLMRSDIASVSENSDLLAALAVMREHGVRRLLVVGKGGVLAGLVSADDLLTVMAEQMDGLASMVRAELSRERETRQAR